MAVELSCIARTVNRSSASAGVPPLRFFVQRVIGDLAQARMTAPYTPTCRGELAPGGSSMNGMNLSGKPGIVQPMQIPPTFGQPPIPLIQPRLGTLHFTTGPQQPSLTMHLRRSILGREIALLVIAGAVATLVHSLAEQPGGPQTIIERNHRRQAGSLIEQVERSSP